MTYGGYLFQQEERGTRDRPGSGTPSLKLSYNFHMFLQARVHARIEIFLQQELLFLVVHTMLLLLFPGIFEKTFQVLNSEYIHIQTELNGLSML